MAKEVNKKSDSESENLTSDSKQQEKKITPLTSTEIQGIDKRNDDIMRQDKIYIMSEIYIG